MQIQVRRSDYRNAAEQFLGWCIFCSDFTTGDVEPDAEAYKCEACGEYGVSCAEDAMMAGLFMLGEEAES